MYDASLHKQTQADIASWKNKSVECVVLSGKYLDKDKESIMWVSFYVIKVCINENITSMYTDCSGFDDNNCVGFELCCDCALHWLLNLLKTSLWAAQG